MLKLEVNYVDFNGNEKTKDTYFNLTREELTELECTIDGTFSETVKKAIATDDTSTMFKMFKKLILASYGVKSSDGESFIKIENGKKLCDDFAQTAVYAKVFEDVTADDKAAADFFNAVIEGAVGQENE